MGIIRDFIRRAARAAGKKELLRSVRARQRGIFHLLRPSYPIHRSDAFEYPLHRQEPVEPFFIVGSGRCGTTLMRRLLQASPRIHIPPENWAMAHHVDAFRCYRGLLSWGDLVDLHLGKHSLDNDRWFDEPPIELRDHLRQVPWDERSLARLLDIVYRYHGRLQGAVFERWGDKTPLNVESMEGILDIFPQAKFIHLLRDGVDVVHSWAGLEKYAGEFVAAARRWKSAVTAAHDFEEHHPEQFLEVRYEDLCQAPKTALHKVCSFIDLSYEEDMLSRSDHFSEMETAQSIDHYQNAFESITTKSIGKGRRGLDSEQKGAIKPLLDAKLTDLGYAPVGE